jgi:hypothetical protein
MDDPMVRSRLGRIKGTRLWGLLIPSRGPLFFSLHIASFAYRASDCFADLRFQAFSCALFRLLRMASNAAT